MEFSVESEENKEIIKLSGDLTYNDHFKSKEIETLIKESSAAKIVVLLTEVDFIDSMGLGMLMLWKHSAEDAKIAIEFCSPSEKAARSLKAGKLDRFLPVDV